MKGQVTKLKANYLSLTGYRLATEEDKEDAFVIDNAVGRVMRGRSFLAQSAVVRSAYRNSFLPAYSLGYVGFRPARTIQP